MLQWQIEIRSTRKLEAHGFRARLAAFHASMRLFHKLNSVERVRERTILTEQQLIVGEVRANVYR
jgi:phage replication-related protein YjqB (UPF0714/DUF867 family)